MKRIAFLIIFSMIACLAVAAQEKPQEKPKTDAKPADAKPADAKPAASKPAEALPAAETVLDKFVTAIGGKEAIMKQTSRTMKGSFAIEAMNMEGTIEINSKAPNKNSVVVALPGVGNFNQVF